MRKPRREPKPHRPRASQIRAWDSVRIRSSRKGPLADRPGHNRIATAARASLGVRNARRDRCLARRLSSRRASRASGAKTRGSSAAPRPQICLVSFWPFRPCRCRPGAPGRRRVPSSLAAHVPPTLRRSDDVPITSGDGTSKFWWQETPAAPAPVASVAAPTSDAPPKTTATQRVRRERRGGEQGPQRRARAERARATRREQSRPPRRVGEHPTRPGRRGHRRFASPRGSRAPREIRRRRIRQRESQVQRRAGTRGEPTRRTRTTARTHSRGRARGGGESAGESEFETPLRVPGRVEARVEDDAFAVPRQSRRRTLVRA